MYELISKTPKRTPISMSISMKIGTKNTCSTSKHGDERFMLYSIWYRNESFYIQLFHLYSTVSRKKK